VGRIPEEDVDRVRDATDIISLVSETVQLKQKGRLWWGCCPFHTEKTPSFKVDPSSGLWHCFGCGTGGDAIGFVMKAENLDFPDAVRRLAERAHVEIHEESTGMPRGQKERLLAASEEAAAYFHELLTKSRDPRAAEARDYLKSRGFGIDVAKRFRLGFAPPSGSPLATHLAAKGFTSDELVLAGLASRDERGNVRDRFFGRLMFPIGDLTGRTIAFGGRVLGDGRPKYLNSAETPIFHKSSNLYAIDRAKNEIVRTGTAIVVEGYTDVIALHVAGLPYAVATLGTALTEQHVRLLARFAKRVVYLFDGDDAGVRAARRAEEFLDWQARPEFQNRLGKAQDAADLRVALIPEGKDPADFVAAYGAERMARLVDEASPLVEFLVDAALSDHDIDTPEGRSAGLHAAAAVIARLADSLLVHDYTNHLAGRLLVDYRTVQQAVLEAARRPLPKQSAEPGETAPAAPAPKRVNDPQALAEQELLAVLARSPRLRAEAVRSLPAALFADPSRRRLIELFAEAGDVTGQALFEAVTAWEPSAAYEVSMAVTDEGDEDADDENFRQLTESLKEFGLRRQMNELQARLRALDPVKDRDEYDDVFRSIATLRDRRPAELKIPGRKKSKDMEA
jgi:DNA primase